MVEITLPIVLQILQTAGILVGIIYYITIMRNSQRNQELARKAQEQAVETRQAQLFMQLHNRLDKDFSRSLFKLFRWEWDDYDDFQEKYGWRNNEEANLDWNLVGDYLEGMGVLVREGYVDIRLVALMISGMIKDLWEKFNPIIFEFRRRENYPRYFIEFEYLYNALVEYSQKHPELQMT